ncbi:MAG: type II toxin-antitoxin system RelE/ParE family toxin [Sphingobium sp.]
MTLPKDMAAQVRAKVASGEYASESEVIRDGLRALQARLSVTHSIALTPEARDQLDTIYNYIAAAASPDIAQRFTDGIVEHIGKLTDYPRRGTMRDDLRTGLRAMPSAAASRSPLRWKRRWWS